MKPELQDLLSFTNYDIVPVYEELLSDFTTPLNVLRNIMSETKKFYLLESVEQAHSGRYSYLGYNPLLTVKAKDNYVYLNNNKEYMDNPFNKIKEILSSYKAPRFDCLPPFCGGFVGYASYDSYKYFEPKLKINAKDVGFDDFEFMLFDKVICFDNYLQKIFIIVNVKTYNLKENYLKAKQDIEEIKKLIVSKRKHEFKKPKLIEDLKSIDNKEEYTKKLLKVKDYIYNGDIFQCVFSRRFKGKLRGNLLETYRHLRTINPSPYMYYFRSDALEIVGASPETLVSKEKDIVTTFPIAGTRKRGATVLEDNALEKELLADEKEKAEHNMLVDLGRNDIGRVSKFGTVKVANYMEVLKYSHVMHLASTVVGTIKDDLTSVDVLQSILPAGTLSGAPKLRACEIIDELELERRGIYGGGIGYIDFTDNMNICIVIRTIFKYGDNIYVQAGGGIVMDSLPEAEYLETENKAMAVFKAVKASIKED